MNEKDYLLAFVDDKLAECESKNVVTNTNFLDIYQQSSVITHLKFLGIKYELYGGFENSERKIVVFFPDYADGTDYLIENPDLSPIVPLRIDKDSFSKLSHRDYLGAIMGLGIKREMLGDIYVDEKGCTTACIKSVAKYIKENLVSVGRGSVEISFSDNFANAVQTEKFVEKRCSVSSMRIDSVISAVFNISRGDAVCRILRGEVFLNGVEVAKTDLKVPFMSKIVLRGFGKAVISDDLGVTKKGKQAFNVKKYI